MKNLFLILLCISQMCFGAEPKAPKASKAPEKIFDSSGNFSLEMQPTKVLLIRKEDDQKWTLMYCKTTSASFKKKGDGELDEIVVITSEGRKWYFECPQL